MSGSWKLLKTFLIDYSDSGFTNPHEVLLPDEAPSKNGCFSHMGAQYSGFETARHAATAVDPARRCFTFDSSSGHWLKIGLQSRSLVERVTVSTLWFTGNHVPYISVWAVDEQKGHSECVLEHVVLEPNATTNFLVKKTYATQIRVQCHFEGGISRLHFYGQPGSESSKENLLVRAKVLDVSNEHYGSVVQAITGNRQQDHMIGWETARTGYGEYALFELSASARVKEVVVDTYLHRLNAPLACFVFGLPEGAPLDKERFPRWVVEFSDGSKIIPLDFRRFMAEGGYEEYGESRFDVKLELPRSSDWVEIVPFGLLRRDAYNIFRSDSSIAVQRLFVLLYPNGGIHGLKVFGEET